MMGEAGSWNDIIFHVAIFSKNYSYMNFKLIALFCHTKLILYVKFYLIINGISEYECSCGGVFCSHSIEELFP